MALPMCPSPMKPTGPSNGFCAAIGVRPDDTAEALTPSLTETERDLVSCIFSSQIDACCCFEHRESIALRPRGNCGKRGTLAPIGNTVDDQSDLGLRLRPG